ncbi:MAG TPA: ComGF family competence protein [Virgibacillus sp.]|nr:ComGF family competence protein [Virgibacillus sp.]
MKSFAYMERMNNNAGFTFISLLITLIIISTTLPLLVQLTKTVSYRTNYSELSIHQFYHFLRDDLIEATAFQVSEHTLKLRLSNGESASYSMYGRLIRRQVDGQGHEIYVRDVKDIIFTELSYGILAEVTSLEGDVYEKVLIFYE